MSIMSDLHVSSCETIYDILRNRLGMPSEECTYELAVDIFEAIVDNLEVINEDSKKTLELYKHKLDFEMDQLRDLCEERNTAYNRGYFNAVHDMKGYLDICESLGHGEPWYNVCDKAFKIHKTKLNKEMSEWEQHL